MPVYLVFGCLMRFKSYNCVTFVSIIRRIVVQVCPFINDWILKTNRSIRSTQNPIKSLVTDQVSSHEYDKDEEK